MLPPQTVRWDEKNTLAIETISAKAHLEGYASDMSPNSEESTGIFLRAVGGENLTIRNCVGPIVNASSAW